MMNSNRRGAGRFAAIGLGLSISAIPLPVLAHCPLCTAGAGVLAVAAAAIGVNPTSIGVFTGAFAVATGLWAARVLRKKYIPFQTPLIAAASFALTIFPLMPLFDTYHSFLLTFGGAYGSIFNRTYLVNRFLLGSILGALLLVFGPAISRGVTRLIGKHIPYQGMAISFSLLILSAVIVQFLV